MDRKAKAFDPEGTPKCDKRHNKHTGWPLTDCKGIFLRYVCEHCEEEARKSYAPWVFDGYTQEDIDEQIEPDNW